jgi:hypothetical protein
LPANVTFGKPSTKVYLALRWSLVGDGEDALNEFNAQLAEASQKDRNHHLLAQERRQ